MKLGVKIGQWREAQGMNRVDLSAAAGVDRKTLRTIESGERAGQPAKLKAILETLSIPQTSDYDRYDDRTRAFIASTAPVFAQLPDWMKSEALGDVVSLLSAKLARAAGIPTIGVAPLPQDEAEDHEAYAARAADPDTGGGED